MNPLETSTVPDAKPTYTQFMDPEMLRLWRRIEALPGGLRLYGGTALALYLNHRQSTDFDFATPESVVDLQFVADIPWLAGAELRGGSGMVDAVWHGESRAIMVTFMECGHMVPMPTREPLLTDAGVAVAHPVDIIASKIEACMSRNELRDCEDMEAVVGKWRQWFSEALDTLPGRSEIVVYGRLAEMSEQLPAERCELFQKQLRALGRGDLSERGQ